VILATEATLIVRDRFTGWGFGCFDPRRLGGKVMHQLLNDNSGEVRSGRRHTGSGTGPRDGHRRRQTEVAASAMSDESTRSSSPEGTPGRRSWLHD